MIHIKMAQIKLLFTVNESAFFFRIIHVKLQLDYR